MDTEMMMGDPLTEKTETVSQKKEDDTSTDEISDVKSDSTSQENTEETTDSSSESKWEESKKALLSDLHKERSARKELQLQVEKLTSDLSDLKDSQEKLESLQNKYSRLEKFILDSGSELSRILDSRTFTDKLFNSEEDVKDLIKEWYKQNPNETARALGSKSSNTQPRVSINDLLRAVTNG